MGVPLPTGQVDIISIRRKALLLGGSTALLVGAALGAFANGYPAGLVLLAAAVCQAALCSALYRSDLLKLLLGTSFLLFLVHGIAIAPLLEGNAAQPAAMVADFLFAVLATASLVYTPIQTMALVVRKVYMDRRERPR